MVCATILKGKILRRVAPVVFVALAGVTLAACESSGASGGSSTPQHDDHQGRRVGWREFLILAWRYIGPRRTVRTPEAARSAMSPEHYVRPDGDDRSAPLRRVKRAWLRFTVFMFHKKADLNPPGIHPQKGFNANGRRHS
jgi:hypothetical protein